MLLYRGGLGAKHSLLEGVVGPDLPSKSDVFIGVFGSILHILILCPWPIGENATLRNVPKTILLKDGAI